MRKEILNKYLVKWVHIFLSYVICTSDYQDEEQQEEQEGDEEISKDSPMYVPKGPYYCHDSRFDDIDEEQEEEGDEIQKKKE